jgi:hypothetical protein
MFGHRLPSPAEITQAATRRIPLETRTLPVSRGLSYEQMADVIRAADLEPLHVSTIDPKHLRAAIRAYAAAGIPTILIGNLRPKKTDGMGKVIGVHAVTVTGYHLAGESFVAASDALRSDHLNPVEPLSQTDRLVPRAEPAEPFASTFNR